MEESKKVQVKVAWKKQGKGYKKACWVSPTEEDTDRPIRRVGHGQQELHLLLLVSPVSPSSLQGQNYSVETCEILGCSR